MSIFNRKSKYEFIILINTYVRNRKQIFIKLKQKLIILSTFCSESVNKIHVSIKIFIMEFKEKTVSK